MNKNSLFILLPGAREYLHNLAANDPSACRRPSFEVFAINYFGLNAFVT